MVHRRELPELIRLATEVEARHQGHPDVPFGLAGVLSELAQALDDLMEREETELFPRLRRVEPGSGRRCASSAWSMRGSKPISAASKL
jgi:iron-sulfur cluster repair protein YtfE (RIC family)